MVLNSYFNQLLRNHEYLLIERHTFKSCILIFSVFLDRHSRFWQKSRDANYALLPTRQESSIVRHIRPLNVTLRGRPTLGFPDILMRLGVRKT